MTSRRFEHVLVSPPEQVAAALRDRSVAQRRADATEPVRSVLQEHDVASDRVATTVRSELPTQWFPAPVRSRLGADPAVVRTETWDLADPTSLRGVMALDLGKAPATASAIMACAPESTGSRLTYDITVDVRVPFIGRVVEQSVLGQIERLIGREAGILDEGAQSG